MTRGSSAGTQQSIDDVRRLARAVRAEAAYLRSLSLEPRKQRRAVLPKAPIDRAPPVTDALRSSRRREELPSLVDALNSLGQAVSGGG